MLGLYSKEPSLKQSAIALADGSSFNDKGYSEGPSLTIKDYDRSTPEMIGDESES